MVPVGTAHVGSVTLVVGADGAPGADATGTFTVVEQPAVFLTDKV